MIVLYLELILCCVLIFTAQCAVAFDDVFASELQNSLELGIAKLEIPGAVMIVQSSDGDSWTGTAGVSRYSPDTPMVSDVSFHIGSVTKTMTATIILQLVDEKRLALDTALEHFFPGIVPNADIITIRDLLQMRSGLADYEDNSDFDAMESANHLRKWRPIELIQYANATRRLPGQTFDYNNAGYVLLGMVIEKLTEKSFESNIRDRIADPLGLTKTYAPVQPVMPEPYAHGYTDELTGTWGDFSEGMDPSSTWAAGCVVSTPSETLRWLRALLDGELISTELQAERMSIPVDSNDIGYGLGIFRSPWGIGHDGDFNSIYTAWATGYRGWYMVILCNGRTAQGNDLSTADKLVQHITAQVDFPVASFGNFTVGGQGCMFNPGSGFSMEFLLLGLGLVPVFLLRRFR